ncbi:hypothetical protein [Lacticaseibacillus sp. 53-4]|uniref:hypothetical protein n=1 Tax=Lacticaseibacillus sp. 53-4 TaxID=2799575 RepID=UPI001942843D|nr:hypothetical protein [Lacticaseibacillus sp. 53-4]
MKQVKEALSRPPLLAFPERDALTVLNGRMLIGTQLVNGEVTLPANGTFDRLIHAAKRHETIATVSDNQLILSEKKAPKLTLEPTAVDVFIAKVNAQEFSLMSSGPTYISVLHLVDQNFDFYLSFARGQAAKYLIEHPQGLPVNDVMGLKHIDTGKTVLDFDQAITSYGYDKLVAGTELAFLDYKEPAATSRIRSIYP